MPVAAHPIYTTLTDVTHSWHEQQARMLYRSAAREITDISIPSWRTICVYSEWSYLGPPLLPWSARVLLPRLRMRGLPSVRRRMRGGSRTRRAAITARRNSGIGRGTPRDLCSSAGSGTSRCRNITVGIATSSRSIRMRRIAWKTRHGGSTVPERGSTGAGIARAYSDRRTDEPAKRARLFRNTRHRSAWSDTSPAYDVANRETAKPDQQRQYADHTEHNRLGMAGDRRKHGRDDQQAGNPTC